MLPGWLFAWVALVFVPSALIALAGLSPLAAASDAGLLGRVWIVGDEVGPAVKLSLGALLAVFLVGIGRSGVSGALRHGLVLVACMGAVVLALAFVPEGHSRGFGIGLAGSRFDGALMAIYAVGAMVAALVFELSVARCGRR